MSHNNLAKHKPSNQSSTLHRAIGGNASSDYAVDGVWNSNMLDKSKTQFQCSHTLQRSKHHWWMVNLEKTKLVRRITILNRGDCCAERLNNVTVTVGDVEGQMKQCGRFMGPGGKGELVEISCSTPLFGQFVKIEKYSDTALTLCELLLFGDVVFCVCF
ncbi:fucolectin-like [Ruditapes philippinarum]|uniref:fucolectin-like n=1 Tax=Ruditapes philippinarum TaxID=129788 RepID=UPI00295C25C1|nr:fucolectin-like [Ruditapes philippinarum]